MFAICYRYNENFNYTLLHNEKENVGLLHPMLLSAAAMLIAFINSKIIKMQTTIAITAGSMMLSILIIIAGQNDWFYLAQIATDTVTRINFESFC